MNEIRLERIHASNRLKRFKIKNTENSLTEQIETREMLNITFENSTDAMKKWNIVNRNVRIIDKIRNEVVRNIDKDLSADDQIVENIIANNNLLNSKTRNTYAIDKFSARRSNWLIEIENSLSRIDRKKDTAVFVAIDKILMEKK